MGVDNLHNAYLGSDKGMFSKLELRSRIIFMYLRLRVKILMRLRLLRVLPYYIRNQLKLVKVNIRVGQFFLLTFYYLNFKRELGKCETVAACDIFDNPQMLNIKAGAV
jgi:hypothetical protein